MAGPAFIWASRMLTIGWCYEPAPFGLKEATGIRISTMLSNWARLKKGITNLRYGLNQVMQLRPVTFQWKDRSDGRTHLGLIAQEVETVIPEMIEKGTDPSQPLGMNYNNLIPVLIKAIQEQQQALEGNQAEIKNLRAENDALSKRIFALEQSRRRTH